MADVNLRSLKFAILECLASGRGSQYKFNLIGKGYSVGDLESSLGIRFDPTQRHLAVTAFNELEQAALIRPTYTDQFYPEEWVEITGSGREALVRRQLDALDGALSRIAPNLVEIRAGAWSAITAGRPDALRQAAHSARELIGQTLKEGAPDKLLKAKPWYTPEKTSHSGITRRHRLRYLMETRRGAASDLELKVADQACELVLVTDERLKALAHARNTVAASDVRDALVVAEMALRCVLLADV